MSITEKHIRARSSSNLKPSPDKHGGALDVLTAAGMAAQTKDQELAGYLLGCMGTKSRNDLYGAFAGLRHRLHKHMLAKRVKGDSELIVTEVMGWWLDSTCKVCHGKKFQLNEGTPTLSARHCRACGGTGLRPIKTKNRELFDWTLALIEKLVSNYGSLVREKMG